MSMFRNIFNSNKTRDRIYQDLLAAADAAHLADSVDLSLKLYAHYSDDPELPGMMATAASHAARKDILLGLALCALHLDILEKVAKDQDAAAWRVRKTRQKEINDIIIPLAMRLVRQLDTNNISHMKAQAALAKAIVTKTDDFQELLGGYALWDKAFYTLVQLDIKNAALSVVLDATSSKANSFIAHAVGEWVKILQDLAKTDKVTAVTLAKNTTKHLPAKHIPYTLKDLARLAKGSFPKGGLRDATG